MSSYVEIIDTGSVQNGKLLLTNPANGGRESFDLTAMLNEDAGGLVVSAKTKLKDELKFAAVLTALNRSLYLLHATAKGLKGVDSCTRVAKTFSDLAALGNECVDVVKSLDEGTRTSLRQLVSPAIKALLQGEESKAMAKILKCVKRSKAMATSCEEICGRFRSIRARVDSHEEEVDNEEGSKCLNQESKEGEYGSHSTFLHNSRSREASQVGAWRCQRFVE